MIAVNDLLADFRRMLSERWAYAWGAAERGRVDCAGAFVWAFRQHGASIYHGSNRIARTEVDGLRPIGSVAIVPGMVAVKHRIPGDPGYALPSAYQPGGAQYNGDLNDYYHIGLVDEDTARVLNAQSAATGFVASAIGKGWTHVGHLRQVDYGGQAPANPEDPAGADRQPDAACGVAVVWADNGKPVKMRDKPSESCRIWTELPVGTVVTLRGAEKNGWTPIRCGTGDGYMMAKYLKARTDAPAEPEPGEGSGEGYTSYALEIYDLTYEQAVGIQSEITEYKSRIAGRNG